jgi:hypothetical protein
MKGFSVFVVTVACAIVCDVSNAQESPSPAKEPTSISPDKKWEYVGGDTPKLVKVATSETVIDFFAQRNPGTAPAGEDPEVLWAPASKRFAFNYSPLHAHHMTFQSVAFYQLRGDKWVALHSPGDDVSEGSQLAQPLKKHLPRKFNPRDCARDRDVLDLREWTDSSTAILYAPCYERNSEKLKAALDLMPSVCCN